MALMAALRSFISVGGAVPPRSETRCRLTFPVKSGTMDAQRRRRSLSGMVRQRPAVRSQRLSTDRLMYTVAAARGRPLHCGPLEM